jgi:hypothetical protein
MIRAMMRVRQKYEHPLQLFSFIACSLQGEGG